MIYLPSVFSVFLTNLSIDSCLPFLSGLGFLSDLFSLVADPGLAGSLDVEGGDMLDLISFLDEGKSGGLPVNIWSKFTLAMLYFSNADFCNRERL